MHTTKRRVFEWAQKLVNSGTVERRSSNAVVHWPPIGAARDPPAARTAAAAPTTKSDAPRSRDRKTEPMTCMQPAAINMRKLGMYTVPRRRHRNRRSGGSGRAPADSGATAALRGIKTQGGVNESGQRLLLSHTPPQSQWEYKLI